MIALFIVAYLVIGLLIAIGIIRYTSEPKVSLKDLPLQPTGYPQDDRDYEGDGFFMLGITLFWVFAAPFLAVYFLIEGFELLAEKVSK